MAETGGTVKKKKRRERRMQTAVEMLAGGLDVDGIEDFGDNRKEKNDADVQKVFESSDDDAHHRSHENTSQVSSHMFQPRWKRLVRAASKRLSARMEVSESATVDRVRDQLREQFTDRDAIGGGSTDDVSKLLGHWLDILGLHDKDTGFVLLSVFQFLQAGDLPWSSATWRPMLLTSIFAAIDKVCEAAEERSKAKERLQRDVVHWWSQPRTDAACEAFTSREQFRLCNTSRSALARIYFELRDQGLKLSPDNSSNASAVNGMFSPMTSRQSHMRDLQAAASSILNSGCSFDLSETTSFSFSREDKRPERPERPKNLMSL